MILTNFGGLNWLSGNDIWVNISGFNNPTKRLKLNIKNLNNNKFCDLILYPSVSDEYDFNICIPVRALFDTPNHLSSPLNTIANFRFSFVFEAKGVFPDQLFTAQRKYIRGWKIKENDNDFYINDSTNLFIGPVYGYSGFDKYHRLNENGEIVEQTTTNLLNIDVCNYKIIKFLNSIGGYQYQMFEGYEIKTNSKPLKNVPKKASKFKDAGFKSLGTEINTEIEFYTNAKTDEQEVITELMQSYDVMMWDEVGQFWIKLVPNSNSTVFNTVDKMYSNKIKYDFYTEINNSILW